MKGKKDFGRPTFTGFNDMPHWNALLEQVKRQRNEQKKRPPERRKKHAD